MKKSERLLLIKREMESLLQQASDIVNSCENENTKNRANYYWIPTIEKMLDNDGGYDFSLNVSIREIETIEQGLNPEDVIDLE